MIHLMLLLCAIIMFQGCGNAEIHCGSAVNNHKIARVSSNPKNMGHEQADEQSDLMREPSGSLSLRQALKLTLMHNPRLQVFSYEIRAAQARQLQSGYWENPELGVDIENFGGSGSYSGFDSSESTIQLSQLIPMGNKVKKRQAVYSYDTKLSELDYEAERLDITTSLAKTFVNLLLVQEKVELSQELLQISREIANAVDKRVQAGKDSPTDLSKANIAVAKAEIQHYRIKQQKSVFRKRLASFWASQSPVFTELTGQLYQIEDIPELSSLQNLLQNNPDVARWAVEVQKRKAQIQLSRSESIPDISIGGGIKHFSETDDAALVFGISMPLPIVNQNKYSRREANHNLNKTLTQQKASFLDACNELNRLYVNLDNAHAKAKTLKNKVLKTSGELLEASRISYEQGKIDYLTLLDAQRIYFESKNDYIDALAEYHISKTELERLAGKTLKEISTSLK